MRRLNGLSRVLWVKNKWKVGWIGKLVSKGLKHEIGPPGGGK